MSLPALRKPPPTGPATAFRRLLETEAGDDRRAWLECFTSDSLEMVRDSQFDKPGELEGDGLVPADLELRAIDLFMKLPTQPDSMTFAHEVSESQEKIVEEGVGWVVRLTRAGRERKYWCRIEDGRWRVDFKRTRAEE